MVEEVFSNCKYHVSMCLHRTRICSSLMMWVLAVAFSCLKELISTTPSLTSLRWTYPTIISLYIFETNQYFPLGCYSYLLKTLTPLFISFCWCKKNKKTIPICTALIKTAKTWNLRNSILTATQIHVFVVIVCVYWIRKTRPRVLDDICHMLLLWI